MNKNYRETRQSNNFWVYGFQNPLDHSWNSCDESLPASMKLEDEEKDAVLDAFIDMMVESLYTHLITEKCMELEKMQKQYGAGTQLVLFALPEGGYKICTRDEAEAYLKHNEIMEDRETVFDGMLVAGYDSLDVIYLGNSRYLCSPMIIYGLDESGETCGIDTETFIQFLAGAERYRTVLEDGERKYPVFRLD